MKLEGPYHVNVKGTRALIIQQPGSNNKLIYSSLYYLYYYIEVRDGITLLSNIGEIGTVDHP
jgi:hypothetical protein